jgi:acyl-CoA thioester hydrolase
MTQALPAPAPGTVFGDIEIRVRYAETDRMGLLHHANYLVYFEQGRIELLRSMGEPIKMLKMKATF